MKAKFLGMFAMAALLLTSCDSKPTAENISDIKNADVNDSISNYLGQFAATSYWRMAANDTTFKTEKSKEAYLKGFAKGMEMTGDDEAYNMGLMQGLQAVMQLKSIDKTYGTSLKNDKYLGGLAYGLKSDSIVNVEQLQKNMSQIQVNLEAEKTKREKVKIDSITAQKISKEGYKKQPSGIVSKALKAGNGVMPADGQWVLIEMNVKDVEGKEIFPAERPMPIQLGKNQFPYSINNAIMTMKIGSTYSYLIPTVDLFGSNRPTESLVVNVTISLKGFCNEKGEPTDAPVSTQPESTSTVKPVEVKK